MICKNNKFKQQEPIGSCNKRHINVYQMESINIQIISLLENDIALVYSCQRNPKFEDYDNMVNLLTAEENLLWSFQFSWLPPGYNRNLI